MSMREPTCADVRRGLCAFVDGELEPSHALAMQAHVDGCEACAARVAFARSTRCSVRSVVKSVSAPAEVRARMTAAVQRACDARDRGDVMIGSGLFSWKVAGPLAGAAALVLLWASVVKWQGQAPSVTPPSASTESQASMVPVDTLLDTLVQQHANPLPPETTDPTDIARFDRFVGVPLRAMQLDNWQGRGRLLGARMIPLQDIRTAMFQYVTGNGGRISVYVYNPSKVRRVPSHILRKELISDPAGPVYVGYVRGYSVAVTSRRGVGYVMASDLDEKENSKLLLAVGNH